MQFLKHNFSQKLFRTLGSSGHEPRDYNRRRAFFSSQKVYITLFTVCSKRCSDYKIIAKIHEMQVCNCEVRKWFCWNTALPINSFAAVYRHLYLWGVAQMTAKMC